MEHLYFYILSFYSYEKLYLKRKKQTRPLKREETICWVDEHIFLRKRICPKKEEEI